MGKIRLLALWVGVSIAGSLVGILGVFFVTLVETGDELRAGSVDLVPWVAAFTGDYAVRGLALASFQSLILKHALGVSRSAYIVVTVLATGLVGGLLALRAGLLLDHNLRATLGLLWTWDVSSLSSGAIIGAGQMLVLRRYVRQAAWWVAANAVGYGLALGVGMRLGPAWTILVVVVVPVFTGVTLLFFRDDIRRGTTERAVPTPLL